MLRAKTESCSSKQQERNLGGAVLVAGASRQTTAMDVDAQGAPLQAADAHGRPLACNPQPCWHRSELMHQVPPW